MQTTSKAWLLPQVEGIKFAVAEQEMQEYLVSPMVFPVPLAPAHCAAVIAWHGNIIPLMDLRTLLGVDDVLPAKDVVVLAYQVQPLAPLNYLALVLGGVPSMIRVSDEQACELPVTYSEILQTVALACFIHDEVETIVLDVTYLSSGAFREQVRMLAGESVPEVTPDYQQGDTP